MPLFRRRSGADALPAGPPPRDVETLERLLGALHVGVVDTVDAHRRISQTIAAALELSYVGVWHLVDGGVPHLVAETGGPDGGPPVSPVAGSGRLPALWRQVVEQRTPVSLDAGTPGGAVPRWDAAAHGGALAGALVPMSTEDAVVAVLECYAAVPLPFFGPRAGKWETILRIAADACEDAVATSVAGAAVREAVDDRDALTAVVAGLGRARDETAALDVALSTVRESFGWSWAGCWRAGSSEEPSSGLRLVMQSRDRHDVDGPPAGAPPGVAADSLVRRAWGEQDLVTGTASDGRSGVAFPLLDSSGVSGVMEFSTQSSVTLSDSRRSALRNVQALVGQRLEVLRRSAVDASSAHDLLDTVMRLRASALDATRVAEGAVAQASAMTTEVEALSSASSAIGDVIAVISGIAQQTNLLSLNATIEAARAGQVGLGFAVVAAEVKELARETAAATTRVAGQIAGIQASSRAVSDGIHATADIIGEMDAVQARIGAVLEEQTRMARAFDRRA